MVAYPTKNIGDDMKKGIVIVGVILLVIGLVMMLFMWPFIGTKTWEEMKDEEPNDGETYKIKGEITDELTIAGLTMYEIDDGDGAWVADEDAFDKGDAVIVEFTWDEDKATQALIDNPEDPMAVYDALDAKIYKTPTPLGIIGLILLIVGIILLIVGAATGRAAPVAPAQPPMEQPPYEEPPYQQPPMQQPPYQRPPPQQPPMPPPPPR